MLNISDFHHFLFFYISQGSVPTLLRCGVTMETDNLLVNAANAHVILWYVGLIWTETRYNKNIVVFVLIVISNLDIFADMSQNAAVLISGADVLV